MLLRLLEIGLAVVVVAAPIPSGAVHGHARTALEIAALVLTALWLVRGASGPLALPPVSTRAGLLGLLLLGMAQIVPLGATAVSALSPSAARVRAEAPATVLAAERGVLGTDPAGLDRAATLSVDPTASASALRTGASIAGLFLVALSVVAARGPRTIVVALLISAAFQGLYGTLVFAADRLGGGSSPGAHGTYVNPNHFACYLAMALAPGLALTLSSAARSAGTGAMRQRVLRILGHEGSRTLTLGLLACVAFAGLLLSFSRAGTALGVGAVAMTFFGVGRGTRATRTIVFVVLVAIAVAPLLHVGSDRLVDRYLATGEEFSSDGGRGMVWLDTLRMAAAFPVAGTGFGTFADAYPSYRSPSIRLFYLHAHNDLVQLLAEGGLLAVVFLAFLLAPLLPRVVGAFAGGGGPLAVGLAAGLGAFLLHALVDFNGHIPANAATAAVLAGALQGLPWIDRG